MNIITIAPTLQARNWFPSALNSHIPPPFMKQNTPSKNQKPNSASPPTTVADLNQSKISFSPPVDEVAKRAYFTYVNQGSLSGHDVQHWLDAETELIAERYLGRVHEFRNPT